MIQFFWSEAGPGTTCVTAARVVRLLTSPPDKPFRKLKLRLNPLGNPILSRCQGNSAWKFREFNGRRKIVAVQLEVLQPDPNRLSGCSSSKIYIAAG